MAEDLFGLQEVEEDENQDMVEKYFKTHKDKLDQVTLDGNIVEMKKQLIDRYIVPPFSILDTRMAYWQKRNRNWLSLGIRSEVGRGDNLCFKGMEKLDLTKYHVPTVTKYGKCLPKGFDAERYGEKQAQATSIFSPVLSEIFYRWFCPEGGHVLDPFAGGSVRGIVACYLGYKYTGIELRPEQIKSNEEQSKEIGVSPTWICDDAINIPKHEGEFDFIFSCPPYYNLEVYSDLPGELSAIPTYEEFLISYGTIIKHAVHKLKDNRFAVFVVANMRDKNGFYRNFQGDTVRAFQNAGMNFYNDVILVNVAGSLPIRITNQFKANRKMGKMHQNILVFYKGDVKEIRNNFSEDI